MGTIPFPLEVFKEVHEEMGRSADRPFPKDPLRRAALVAEEAGECLKEALDLTRGSDQEIAGTDREMSGEPGRRNQGLLYVEALHTAAVAVRLMMEMEKEGSAP